jgi:response regulator RpfG family c-di-GMP phosphodiesterase
VITALGGEEGLDALQRNSAIAVVLSDMRMPGMDGTTFLSRARSAAPDAVRMLLTGQADVSSAIAVVNEGQIFKFLTKPCPPEALLAAFRVAADQHRLVISERVLLEQTLRGSISMLTEVMSLASPVVFGRATRIKGLARELAEGAGLPNVWQIEVAAMLSQVGSITLPQATLEKLHCGDAMSPDEQQQADRLPAMAHSLLGNIPRLEEIRASLLHQTRRFAPGSGPGAAELTGNAIPVGARVLKIVIDFDVLEARGLSAADALDLMRGRAGWYDPALFSAFASLHGAAARKRDIREIPLRLVTAGMTFAEDVKTSAGALLLPRGYKVTDGLCEKIRNFAYKGMVRVIVSDSMDP